MWGVWVVLVGLSVCVCALCWIHYQVIKRVNVLETVVSQMSPAAGRRLEEQGTGVTSNWTAPWGDASEEYDDGSNRA